MHIDDRPMTNRMSKKMLMAMDDLNATIIKTFFETYLNKLV